MSANDFWALAGIAAVSFLLSLIGATVGLVLGHFRLPLLAAYTGSAVGGAATNLAISGLGAAAGSLRHLREGRVSLRVLALVGLPSAAGAVLGVFLFTKVDCFWSHVVIGAVLAAVGVQMLRTKPQPEGSAEEGESAMEAGSPPEWPRWLRFAVEVGVGLSLGVLASVTGLMMSSLRMPMLVKVMKIDPRIAVGSNMLIGFLTAAAGASSSWWLGAGFDLWALLVVGPPTMLGGYLGAQLTGVIRKETLQRLLGGVIAVMGLVMFAQGFFKFTRLRDYHTPPANEAQTRLQDEEDDEWPDLDVEEWRWGTEEAP